MKSRLKASTIDLILESSSALFICGAAFAIVTLLFMKGERSLIGIVVATSLPAAGSLLLLLVALLVPGVFAVGKMTFPLNITLPVIHCSIVYMLAELTKGSFGVEKPPEQLRPALYWDDIGFLVLCMIFQIVLLSTLAAFRSGANPSSGTTAQR